MIEYNSLLFFKSTNLLGDLIGNRINKTGRNWLLHKRKINLFYKLEYILYDLTYFLFDFTKGGNSRLHMSKEEN